MASSLIAFYCFNDNDTAAVKDFSTNGWNSTSVTALAIGTDIPKAIGKIGTFNGSTSKINFGNVTPLDDTLSAFTFCIKFKVSQLGIIHTPVYRNGSFYFKILANNKMKFATYSGGIAATVTSDDAIEVNKWYTVVCTYTTSSVITMNYKLNDVLITKTAACGNILDQPGTDLYMGYDPDAVNYFKGSIEMMSMYSKVISEVEMDSFMEQPSGVKFEMDDVQLQTGDLALNNGGGQDVVVWYEEYEEREFSDGEIHNHKDFELDLFHL